MKKNQGILDKIGLKRGFIKCPRLKDEHKQVLLATPKVHYQFVWPKMSYNATLFQYVL